MIFCRITAFFIVAPIFSARNIPAMFKIGLGFAMSLLIFSVHGSQQTIVATPEFILLILKEILIGLLLGFIVYLFFAIVQTAGSLMDMQIGFAMANVIDPNTGVSAPLLGNFKYMVLMLYFLMLNGHHFLISGLMRSYEWIPLDNDFFAQLVDGNVTQFLVLTFSNTFLIAMQVAAPLIVALFLTDVGLGFLTKSAPQFNVFVVGIPLKIIIGLFLLTLFIPALTVLFEYLFSTMFQSLEQIISILQQ
ncbi:flagellar biosynthetic protein FliR [Paenibacillus yanchengensis]|uniref:Flagellar biosynthetic protein FliR n=1 Tax=Paenibacillus yanchengensis TaxID=2035833 RepID=A0ABW4YM42_9BACL